jgi:hypothetical protein
MGSGCLPCALVVEEPVGPLLIILGDCLWLFMPLEPCLVLLVESPALRLQRFGGKILLKGALLVVEGIEQRVRFYPLVQSWVIEYGQWLLRVVRGRERVGILWLIVAWGFCIRRVGCGCHGRG